MAERNPRPGPANAGRPVSPRERLVDRLPLKEGALVGAGAFVVGLLVTVVVEGSNFARSEPFLLLRGSGVGETDTITYGEFVDAVTPPGSFELGGWFYHKAHFASVTGELIGGTTDTATAEFLPDPGVGLAVPLVVIVAAGYLLVSRNPEPTSADAARAGAAVVAGYGPAALASVFVLSWEARTEFGSTLSLQPDLVTALALTGIVYPAVVGAAGGYLWHYRELRTPGGTGAYGGQGYQRGGYQHGQSPGQQGSQPGGQHGRSPQPGSHQQPGRGRQQPRSGQQGGSEDRPGEEHDQAGRTGGQQDGQADRRPDY